MTKVTRLSDHKKKKELEALRELQESLNKLETLMRQYYNSLLKDKD